MFNIKRSSNINKRNIKIGTKHFVIALLAFLIIFIGIWLLIIKVGEINLLPQEEDSETVEQFHLLSIVDSDNPYFEAFIDRQKINVLLLGTNMPLTDTIMLASFDVDEGRIDLISIPRDTYYPRKGYNTDSQKKINAAYLKEPINTAKAVSDLLQGMPIHYYAVVDFQGVEKIVDAMDGVPMNIPFHMHYTDPYDKPPLYIDLKEGQQVLNGKDAVKFLRFRHGDKGYPTYPGEDMQRMEAQQEFLKSAFQQSLGSLLSVVKSVYNNVNSNIDLATALKITTKSGKLSRDNINSYILPGESQTAPPWYYIQDVDATKALIEEIYAIDVDTTTEGAVTKNEGE